MDNATRRLRARNKEQANKRGQLPEFDKTGLGRKGKSAATFPTRQCDHIEGGIKRLIFKRRKSDNSLYAIPLIKGGTRCTNTELTKGKCLKHLSESGA